MGLEFLGEEVLAVSTNTTFTSATYFPGALRASVQHIAGGNCYYSTAGAAASATGANGEHLIELGDIVIIKGIADIVDFNVISVSGEAAATLQVRFEKIEGAG